MNFKYSVAIPAYNAEKVISETIDSILSQTIKPQNIIVVDDGSLDNTAEICRSYENVQVIMSPNGGPESARKMAIEACDADCWVALCDSDDIWMEDHIERLILLIQKTGADFVFSNFSEFGLVARKESKFELLEAKFFMNFHTEIDGMGFQYLGQDLFCQVAQSNPIFTSTQIFSRDLYDKVGGIDLALARMPAADADLTRRMARFAKIACDHKVTVKIRRDGDTFSAKTPINIGRQNLLEKLLIWESLEPGHIDCLKKIIKKNGQDIFWWAVWQSKWKLAYQYKEFIDFKKLPFYKKIKFLFLCSCILPLKGRNTPQ